MTWHKPESKPTQRGNYVRQTHLGPSLDYWDGSCWWRIRDGAPVVIAANQQMPWRGA